MSGFVYPRKIERRSDIPGVIADLQRMGEPAALRVPILQAIYAGRLAFWELRPESTARELKVFLAAACLPALLIVADDVDEPVGPNGFRTLERALRWARYVVVHGSEGRIAHYAGLVAATELVGRTVLIESTSGFVDAYVEAARRWAPTASDLIIRPPAGGLHPNPGPREQMQ